MPHPATRHPASSLPQPELAASDRRSSRRSRLALWPVLLAGTVRDRLRDDSGYTTETVIVTSLLAAAALAVIAIIIAKITGLANSINV